jgi:transcriptional regulator with XRE-family HTH domain
MVRQFKEALEAHRKEQGVSLKDVADGSGVSYEQLKKVGQRENASTNVDDARKVANHFGLTLDEFLGDRTIEARIEIVQLYNQLSPEERRILQAAALGLSARPGQSAKE